MPPSFLRSEALAEPELEPLQFKGDEEIPDETMLVPERFLGKPLPEISLDEYFLIQREMQTSELARQAAAEAGKGSDPDSVSAYWIKKNAAHFSNLWRPRIRKDTVH